MDDRTVAQRIGGEAQAMHLIEKDQGPLGLPLGRQGLEQDGEGHHVRGHTTRCSTHVDRKQTRRGSGEAR